MDYPKEFNETTFNCPDVYEPHPKIKDKWVKNLKKSEICTCLEALGTPRVYYAGRRNKYYRDMAFTKPFVEEELHSLGLPIPKEIEIEREKQLKRAMEQGLDVSIEEIIRNTSPSVLNPPKEIQDRLASADPLARDINRLNRAILGK